MRDLNDLRRARKAAADKMAEKAAAITALEGNAEATEAQLAEASAAFDAARAEFDKADQAVKRAEAVEAAQASAVQAGDQGTGAAPTQPALAQNPADKGVEVGMMVHALANAKGDLPRAVAALEKNGHSGVSAALSGATEGAGGVTLPRPQAAQVIELLRSRVVVRRAGVMSFPLPAGQIRHARQTGSATAAYVAENAVITASEPTFDKLEQTFKKLTALVPVGNSLLRHTGVEVMRLVRDDLVNAAGLREDLAFLRNDGTGDLPKGLVSWCPAGNNLGSIAAGAAAVETALRGLKNKVEAGNVAMRNCGWIMRPETKNFLAGLRDANGFYIWPSIDAQGTLFSYPIYTSTQLPNNLGVGTNETEVLFVDFDEMMIGDSMTLSLAVSAEASFWTGAAFVSAFSSDMTLLRGISEHDFAPKHDAAIAKLQGIAWAA